MGIIDVHAEIGSTPVWGVSFTEANLARSMQKYGVQRSVISSTIGNSCDFRRGNAQIAKIVESKKAMLGCVVVNMNYPEQAQQEMHAYLTSDQFAALLLTSGIRDRHVTLAETEEILNAHRRFVKPVFLHTPNQEAALAANEIAKTFNVMKFVLLGMGGEDWRMATILAERTLNLVLEVSGSSSPDKIQFAVERIGAHRIVYGSGLPYVDPSAIIGLVQDAEISDSDKNNIFEGSALRLFGWKRSQI
ncbi:MAG: amidohydrolase family protein [Armatimonadetes bacterium]|nr:amidohydrolase family protein [Armatimonadota bacterium]